MNYKELLIKYLEYVHNCEGTDFVSSTPYRLADEFFTEKEWEELRNLAE